MNNITFMYYYIFENESEEKRNNLFLNKNEKYYMNLDI